MAEPLKVRQQQPLSGRLTPAFVEHSDGTGSLEMVDCFSYPPSPRGKELREARLARGVTLGQAARAAGISVSEWSGLERGAYTTDDWAPAFEALGPARCPCSECHHGFLSQRFGGLCGDVADDKAVACPNKEPRQP